MYLRPTPLIWKRNFRFFGEQETTAKPDIRSITFDTSVLAVSTTLVIKIAFIPI
jgi:hypothetical protein